MAYIEGIGREQQMLFPEALEDYVSESNHVRVIDLFVSGLAVEKLGFTRAMPATTGRPGYDPRDLLRLYIYGYINRIRSSRGLEREAERNVEVIWLLRKLRPDFKTIADFRRDHPEALKAVFVAFVQFCKRAALVGGEVVVVDGTKIQASNAREKNQTRSGLAREAKELEERIGRYLREMDQEDRAEEGREELRAKLERVKAKKEEVEALLRELELSGETQRSETDPESRQMKVRGGGTGVCYNVQVAVDAEYHLIVACEVTNEANDLNQLSTMAKAAQETLEADTLDVIADAGYYDGKEIAACEAAGITPLVARPAGAGAEKKGLFGRDRFPYDPERDVYVCPAKQVLSYRWTEQHDGRPMRMYLNEAACAGCPLAAQCHNSKAKSYRYIRRPPEAELLERMQARMRSEPELMQVRKQVVEHPFGTIKRGMDAAYFLLRGKRKAGGEFALTALAYNLKRVLSVLGVAGAMEMLRAWAQAGRLLPAAA
jgi:transposase/transcription elongation GreA/GreB family factor